MRPKSNVREAEPTSGNGIHIIWAIIFTLAAVGVWVFLNRSNIQEYMETQKKRDAARENIQTINNRISLLKKQQQSLNSNGFEGEKQARERLNYHKKGETIMFFVDDADGETTAVKPTPPAKKVP